MDLKRWVSCGWITGLISFFISLGDLFFIKEEIENVLIYLSVSFSLLALNQNKVSTQISTLTTIP